jgi:hypothetical protein
MLANTVFAKLDPPNRHNVHADAFTASPYKSSTYSIPGEIAPLIGFVDINSLLQRVFTAKLLLLRDQVPLNLAQSRFWKCFSKTDACWCLVEFQMFPAIHYQLRIGYDEPLLADHEGS